MCCCSEPCPCCSVRCKNCLSLAPNLPPVTGTALANRTKCPQSLELPEWLSLLALLSTRLPLGAPWFSQAMGRFQLPRPSAAFASLQRRNSSLHLAPISLHPLGSLSKEFYGAKRL